MENSPMLCLDVGGTQIKSGLLAPDGRLQGPLTLTPANALADREELLTHFCEILRGTAGPGGPAPAGVRLAFPGPFDYPRGICKIRGLGKYGALYGVAVGQELAARLAKDPRLQTAAENIRFANDVAAFALGEMRFGEANGAEKAMFVCIGTGCGSAYGLAGQLAPEGTPGVPPGGYLYPLPFRGGCVDDAISRRGLEKLAETQLGAPLDGKALAERCAAGDAGARAVYAMFGQQVAEAFCPALAAYHPEILCLGGQIMASAPLFLGPLSEFCRAEKIKLALTQNTSLRAMQGLLRL